MFGAPYEPTAGVEALTAALGAPDWPTVVDVLNEHWAEIWYAVDPADLRTLLTRIPAEHAARLAHARFLVEVAGLSPEGSVSMESSHDPDALESAAQQIADLRLSGRPLEALRTAESLSETVLQRRGRLVDTTEGKGGLWFVQVGISALLAGDLQVARSALAAATDVHRPVRFPFLPREVAAKLALTEAVSANPRAARECTERAKDLPRTTSWVETMIDDSCWLTDYVLAVDALELDRAEQMRLERPSPLDHLEFWGIALQAHVRHLSLTGRHEEANALYDTIAGLGLPMPGSDGWLASMLSESRLHALPEGDSSLRAPTSAAGVLAHRLGAFLAGDLSRVVAPMPEFVHEAHTVREAFALRLLRAQAFHLIEPTDATRQGVLDVLAEVRDRGVLSTLRYVSRATVDELVDTAETADLVDLIRTHDLPLLTTQAVTSIPLTRAELIAMQHLAAGLSRQEIADELVVSLSTVKTHLRRAYGKLGVTSRSDAIAVLEQVRAPSR